MSNPPFFPRPAAGMTVDEMRRALENISGECRATAAELDGSDAKYLGEVLGQIAQNAETAHKWVLILERGPARQRLI